MGAVSVEARTGILAGAIAPVAIESDTDRDKLLEDFGVTATKGADSITVIYDHGYVEFDNIAGIRPTALALSSDISSYAIVVGDTLAISGTNYTVRVLQPDGTGYTLIVLEEQ